MQPQGIRIRGLRGIPEVSPGDDLVGLIAASSGTVQPPAVFVVAQKAVSKAEGRLVPLESVVPSGKAEAWAARHGKDARLVEVVFREARRIVRMEKGVLIAETSHGWICANAGVDSSNAPPGYVILLPADPDASARRLKAGLEARLSEPLAVIVSDTFGRPWRLGLANVAIGVSGLSPLIDYRGQRDSYGRELRSTVLAVADELAAAAELVMGKNLGIPVAVIEGYRYPPGEGSGSSLIRPREQDLFR